MVLLEKTMSALPLLGAAAAAAALAYLLARAFTQRRFYRNVPCPPHSMFWGHLKLLGEYTARMPKGGYIQQAITQMKQDYDLPDVFYLDMWPATSGFVCMTGPDATAYPTTTNVWPQAPIVTDFFVETTGTTFIEATNGPLWKELLHRIAPGLTPTTIKAYFPAIVAEACSLRDELARNSGAGAPAVRISDAIGRYPFGVIAQVICGEGLGEDVYRDTLRVAELQTLKQTPGALFLPWNKWAYKREVAACLGRIDAVLLTKVRARFAELARDKAAATQRILDRLLLPSVKQGLPLDSALETLCLSNIKGLIIAGYGTTNDTSTFIWLLLHTHPEILEKLRDEHDRVFGKDLDATLTKLRENPGLLNSLEYTTAVIHETLRLFPIGMVVRAVPPGLKSMSIGGKEHPVLPDQMACIVSHAMHYNDEYFPDPKRFLPDRFLNDPAASALVTDGTGQATSSSGSDDDEKKTAAGGKIGNGPIHPRNAYRPFERGPRGCIGQALAMEEMKVQLVVLARSFDMAIEKVEEAGESKADVKEPTFGHMDMEKKLGRHALQVAGFTAGPAGPVLMKVRPRGGLAAAAR
ncbi:cytochrome P450 [Microdochium trichocladiopsis]|uniref:Cytochrome P450 n=1 Tax=Microdochium trichocladiopsis TaxID=1682393 RepID=A0A9P8XWF5_9PEZI|nr:cytochrome P450 [Microdochium trichocladiopsis]KAH7021438.1 cytochrome P450 [Microdochium trichocladiopsis]